MWAASAEPLVIGHNDGPAAVEEFVQQPMRGRVDLAVNGHGRVGRVTDVSQLFRVQRGSTAICDTDGSVRPTHDRPATRRGVSLGDCNDSRDGYRRSIRHARGLIDHEFARCGGFQRGRSRHRAHTDHVTMCAHQVGGDDAIERVHRLRVGQEAHQGRKQASIIRRLRAGEQDLIWQLWWATTASVNTVDNGLSGSFRAAKTGC